MCSLDLIDIRFLAHDDEDLAVLDDEIGRQFYHYLRDEGVLDIVNPVRKNHALKMSRPLPRHLKDEKVESFFQAVKGQRDRAMFMLMLRCGRRVEEVAQLTLNVLDFKHRKVLIEDGKGAKDRVVYLSHDAHQALMAYLRVRPPCRSRSIFLVQRYCRVSNL